MVRKDAVLEVLKVLPDPVDLEELLCRLRLQENIEASERAFDEGRVLPHDEVVRRSEGWFR